MSVINFENPQRQSVFGILFFLLLSIRKSFTAFWPLLVIYVFKGSRAEFFNTYGYLILIVVIIIWVVHSFLSYWYFFFYIENNEFILKKGYLKRVTIAIPFDKIVSINLNQNLLQQLIGVVELEIDSAGSKTKEVKISALNRVIASELEKILSARKGELSDIETPEDFANTVEPTTVFKYQISDLIKVGLTRNHLRGLAIVAAFGFNILQQVDELFEKEIESAAKQTEAFF
jgi:putative membrane protein